MTTVTLTPREMARLSVDARAREELSVPVGVGVVVVDCRRGGIPHDDAIPRPALPVAVVVAIADSPDADGLAEWSDIVLVDGADAQRPGVSAPAGIDSAIAEIAESVDRAPRAAVSLALLLRGAPSRSVSEGLLAESMLYSLLQAGPEFRAWLDRRAPSPRPAEPESPVIVERLDDELRVTLARPHVHNAVNVAMRDRLFEALSLAIIDPDLRTVVLRGRGPSFCSGGDLSEFGTLADPGEAHLVRLTRSLPACMAALADRLEAHVNGVTFGAGIELAAFARSVTAERDTVFALPEVAFGLIPGSGGTVSVPARIGRHRTMWMALTGARVDARTALTWHLVDAVAAAT